MAAPGANSRASYEQTDRNTVRIGVAGLGLAGRVGSGPPPYVRDSRNTWPRHGCHAVDLSVRRVGRPAPSRPTSVT